MTIEVGDYFVVTRGFEFGSSRSSIFSLFGGGEEWKRGEPKPQYDRSYEGYVFRAVAVAGPCVAAQYVFDRTYRTEPRDPEKPFGSHVGSVVSLNMSEIEVMPVGKDYAAALGVDVTEAFEGRVT